MRMQPCMTQRMHAGIGPCMRAVQSAVALLVLLPLIGMRYRRQRATCPPPLNCWSSQMPYACVCLEYLAACSLSMVPRVNWYSYTFVNLTLTDPTLPQHPFLPFQPSYPCHNAVDAHVGRYIFDHCISEAMATKTVVFVTHQLQYLPQVSRLRFQTQLTLWRSLGSASIFVRSFNLCFCSHRNGA